MSEQKPTTQEATASEAKTLKEVAEDYIDALVFTETKASTIKVYRKALDLAIEHFGEQRKIDSIMVTHVGKFYASKEVNFLSNGKPKAAATVKQIKRVFRQCLDFAFTQGLISSLPVPKAELTHARFKDEKPEPKLGDRLRGQSFLPVVKHQK